MAGAAAADLQVYDSVGDDLRIVEHRGLSQEFLSFFASVDRSTPTACATAWRTGLPVIVDRVPASAIFAGQSTLDPMMDAGSRAVASYPLAGAGAAVGVLSLHYAKPPAERASAGLVVLGAAFSLSALNRP